MQLVSAACKLIFISLIVVGCKSSNDAENIYKNGKETNNRASDSIFSNNWNFCYDKNHLRNWGISVNECLSELAEIQFSSEDIHEMFIKYISSTCSDSNYLISQKLTQADCLRHMVSLKDGCLEKNIPTMDGNEFIDTNKGLAKCLMQKLDNKNN